MRVGVGEYGGIERGEWSINGIMLIYKFLKTKIKITYFLALVKMLSRREAQLD